MPFRPISFLWEDRSEESGVAQAGLEFLTPPASTSQELWEHGYRPWPYTPQLPPPVLSLEQEHESLEQENSVLRREIAKLKEELRHLSEALKEHEKMCPLLLCPVNFVQLRPDPVASCLPR